MALTIEHRNRAPATDTPREGAASPPRSVVAGPARARVRVRVRDLIALAKPRITLASGAAAFTGAWLGGGAKFPASGIGSVVLGTCAMVAAACALNMVFERESDARMRRTRRRPLAAGRLSSCAALVFATALALGGALLLAWRGTPAASALGVGSLLVYAGLYTPLKRRSAYAFLVGAVPGAAPALIGWLAISPRLDTVGGHVGGLVVWALFWLWQLPHVIAVQRYLAADYRRAGVRLFEDALGARAAYAVALGGALAAGVVATASVLAFGGVFWAPVLTGLNALVLLGACVWGLSPRATEAQARSTFRLTLAFVGFYLVAALAAAA